MLNVLNKSVILNDLQSGACPTGYSPFTDSGTSRCYKYVSAVKSWPDAKVACESEGAWLATVRSEAFQSFINSIVSANAWVGLTDQAVEGTFVWDHGEPVSYTNWANGEPNNGYGRDEEDCAAMETRFSLQWNDAPCYVSLGYVCETALATLVNPPSTRTWGYTGTVQSYTIPYDAVYIRIQAYGAQGNGGYRSTENAGKGGYVDTNITIGQGQGVTSGQILYVLVGGQDGWNGGGAGSANSEYSGGNGGGASDVRTVSDDATSRIVVAGGGGGTSSDCDGAAGGGLTGASGVCCYNYCGGGGEGASQTAAGLYAGSVHESGGPASAVTNVNGGGGGGGWFGGGGGSGNVGGGAFSFVHLS